MRIRIKVSDGCTGDCLVSVPGTSGTVQRDTLEDRVFGKDFNSVEDL